jgi:hypothetical protein
MPCRSGSTVAWARNRRTAVRFHPRRAAHSGAYRCDNAADAARSTRERPALPPARRSRRHGSRGALLRVYGWPMTARECRSLDASDYRHCLAPAPSVVSSRGFERSERSERTWRGGVGSRCGSGIAATKRSGLALRGSSPRAGPSPGCTPPTIPTSSSVPDCVSTRSTRAPRDRLAPCSTASPPWARRTALCAAETPDDGAPPASANLPASTDWEATAWHVHPSSTLMSSCPHGRRVPDALRGRCASSAAEDGRITSDRYGGDCRGTALWCGSCANDLLLGWQHNLTSAD